jgi:hypothetical protein
MRSSVREAIDQAKDAANDWMDAMRRRDKMEKNKAGKDFMVRTAHTIISCCLSHLAVHAFCFTFHVIPPTVWDVKFHEWCALCTAKQVTGSLFALR